MPIGRRSFFKNIACAAASLFVGAKGVVATAAPLFNTEKFITDFDVEIRRSSFFIDVDGSVSRITIDTEGYQTYTNVDRLLAQAVRDRVKENERRADRPVP